MTEGFVLSMAQDALVLSVVVAGPLLITSLIIGIFISLLQAATQVTEMTLTFVPKLLATFSVLAILGAWMLQQLVSFTVALLNMLPELAQ